MGKAYIKEFERLQDAQSYPMQIWNEPAAVEQTPVDFTSGEAKSAAFGSSTKVVAISVDAICSFLVGTAPTATTAKFRIPADSVLVIGVRGGDKISFISNT